ncbi:DUF2690 domain-containing protein [Streptomyces iakyrus]|uniref:helix-turn-helix domain-containing protein n=1 Tax=Streptomyces iakyrus TaxID=68219 RepID=UPI00339E00B3
MTSTPPGGLPPERARLVSALGELRTGTGLSLAALAAKTTFSKSSWERYLNGKTLPPDQAVRELCRLAGEPEGRCVALWELAEAEWSGRGAPARTDPPAAGEAEAGRPGGGGGAVLAVIASVCALAAGGLSVVLVLLVGQSADSGPGAPSSAVPSPRCRAAGCEGRSPMQMKCGTDPRTLASHRTAGGAHLELRYSARCGAGWARMWSTRIGDSLELNAADGGPAHSARIGDGVAAQSYVYTPMTEARPGTTIQACFRPVAGGGRECFDARV